MASFSTTATLDEPQVSRGNQGGPPPIFGGGDDDRSGRGLPDYSTRLRRARLGLLVALTPVLMLFVSFTSAYVVRQGLPTLDPRTNQLVRDWIPVKLPALLLVNTAVLLISSVGMELARRQTKLAAVVAAAKSSTSVAIGAEGKTPWLAMTIALGMVFLFGQWMAWKQLAASGFYVATTPSSSFVYLLTGAHAVHLMGGILALLVAGLFTLLHRSVTTRSIVVDVTGWYWHFMAVLWVYILLLLEFAR
ncbi:MAG TPA: cytochrome c oxidase subunit 3 [Candidatus Acidoferrum sp.]|nr:cytochrome c oxidase subunit 3 [Candidatus Acidoferrum sp.]